MRVNDEDRYFLSLPATMNPPRPSSMIPPGADSCARMPGPGAGAVDTAPHVVPTTVEMTLVVPLTCRTRQLLYMAYVIGMHREWQGL